MKRIDIPFVIIFIVTLIVILAMAIFMSSCATQRAQSLTPHQQIEMTCNTIGTAYAAATVLSDHGKLTAAQQSALKKAIAVTDQTCIHIPNSWAEVSAGFVDQAVIISALAKGGGP